MAAILVVDDEPVTRAALDRVLSEHGHSVTHAENGRDGLAAAERLRPDIVIMDIRMPELDGLKATESIRKTPGCEDTKVLVLTGDDAVLNRFAAHKAGSHAYLRKPVEQTDLMATVNRLLR
jgi:CheY-like chemotaxis protein